MFNIIFAVVVFSILFFSLLFSVLLGRRFGRWQMTRHSLSKVEVINVIEGSVFALFGLIVAFAFTGAYDRFESRKLHIIEEANVVETAYLSLDLLVPRDQTQLRETFRQYIDTRLAAYKDIPNFKAVNKELSKSVQLQTMIWNQVLAASKTTNDQTVTQLVIPTITKMFEVENAGYAITGVHPPGIIFELLIGLALLSGFLAGYSMAECKVRHSIYLFIYVAITTFILYLIIDLELPRVGLIRVDSFDQFLIDVRNHMNQS
jgi:hypothetical protein